VKRSGRSPVKRRTAAEYLGKKRRSAVREAYERGYGKHPTHSDLAGWADKGSWPKK
jgi:hypothetical protein